jgi:hypothetical protein
VNPLWIVIIVVAFGLMVMAVLLAVAVYVMLLTFKARDEVTARLREFNDKALKR